jgi:hypothetical protein
VAEHRFETGHSIDFSSTSILDKATGNTDHVIKEAIEIRLHPINFNRDRSFTLIWLWYPMTNMLKQYRDLQIQREAQTKQAPGSIHQLPIGSHSELNAGPGWLYKWDNSDSDMMIGTELSSETLVILNQLV